MVGAVNVGAPAEAALSALLLAAALPAPAEAAVAVLGNPSVDFFAAAVCIAAIVLFTVVFEEGLHRLEHKLIGYPLYKSMLETMIKELMILGLISFSLFMLEQFHVLDTSKDSHVRWVVGFEFSHIMIFYMAFGFILKSAMVIRVCSFSSRQWSRLHYETFEQTFDKFVDDSKEQIRKEPLCARLAGNCSRVNASIGSPARQDVIWQLVALHFAKRVKMKHTNFDFARYMRHTLRLKVTHAIHITNKTWLVTATTLVTAFVLWHVTMGCSDRCQEDLEAQMHADDYVLNASGCVDTATDSGRRRLGGGGDLGALDHDTAVALVWVFGIFGWILAVLLFVIAWVLERREEDEHFKALGLTHDGVKLTGSDLVEAMKEKSERLHAEVKSLTDQDIRQNERGFEIPRGATVPTQTVWVGNLPVMSDLAKENPSTARKEKEVLREELDQYFSDEVEVTDIGVRHKKVERSWALVTFEGDRSHIKKVVESQEMKDKGWKIEPLMRERLKSREAEVELQKSDELELQRNKSSSAAAAEATIQGEHDDFDEGEHGHGHGHGHHDGCNKRCLRAVSTDSLILLNCFYGAVYLLYIVYDINKWTGWGGLGKFFAHLLVLLPCMISLVWLGPAALKAASIVEGIEDVNADALNTVIDKMEKTVRYSGALCAALRQEYGVPASDTPSAKPWIHRYQQREPDKDGTEGETAYGKRFCSEARALFAELVGIRDWDELAKRAEARGIDITKDDKGHFFKKWPETPCDDEGLRDVIIADETARIILKVDNGLGQAASGASTAATATCCAGGGAKGPSRKQEAKHVTKDSLLKFYKGYRKEMTRRGGADKWVWKATGQPLQPINMREFAWIMRHVDPDQSGELDQKELTLLLLCTGLELWQCKRERQARVKASMLEALKPASLDGKTTEEKVEIYKKEFMAYDTDHSGDMSWDEMQAVMKKLGHIKSEEEAKMMIAAYDEDKGGTIDFHEYLLLVAEATEDKELAAWATDEREEHGRTEARRVKVRQEKLKEAARHRQTTGFGFGVSSKSMTVETDGLLDEPAEVPEVAEQPLPQPQAVPRSGTPPPRRPAPAPAPAPAGDVEAPGAAEEGQPPAAP